jgi:hypothetical protein
VINDSVIGKQSFVTTGELEICFTNGKVAENINPCDAMTMHSSNLNGLPTPVFFQKLFLKDNQCLDHFRSDTFVDTINMAYWESSWWVVDVGGMASHNRTLSHGIPENH